MTGFESRVRDVINQAAPTYATVSVADRGLSHFMDPSMTGATRFMQKSGYPFPLLTPQMSAPLAAAAAAGTRSVLLRGSRLRAWLLPSMTVSFELLEQAEVESVEYIPADDTLLVVLKTPLMVSHALATRVSIRRFNVVSTEDTFMGAGAVGEPVVRLLSPFLLVVGDTVVIARKKYVLSRAEEVSASSLGRSYDVQVTDIEGLPGLFTDTDIAVVAKPAYRSEILNMPHGARNAVVGGPVALDWVSGPMVADYRPMPESEVFIEEFNAANAPLSAPHQVQKNDTLVRLPILREQMLFWNYAEGSANWNGVFMELRAHASGRAHAWTPVRPPLDPSPLTTVARIVPGFSPYAVIVLARFDETSVVVVDSATKAFIPSTDYSLDSSTGTISFVAGRASQAVLITYRPRLEWQLFARPSVDDVELVVTIGEEANQVFALGAAGSNNTLTVLATAAPDQLHVTARRTDDGEGPFTVEMGDWQMRGGTVAALRYTLTTGADVDYDWVSSGLLVKPLFPVLELLRARLDGESLFARSLDNGRMLL